MEEKEIRTFYCKRTELHDRWVWRTDEYVVNPDDESPHEYLSNCPICDAPTGDVDDQYYSRWKGWQASTGPKTEKGKARSRLNGWRHGGSARKFHMLAPALPGKFAECETCMERSDCESEPYKYCPVLLGPMMRFQQAFVEGRIDELRDFAGMNQLRMMQTVQMMFRELQTKGLMVEKTRETEKDGKFTRESLGFEANPLISKVIDYLQALGHTAEQQMATPKTVQDDETLQGYLQAEGDKRVTLEEYKALQQQRLLALGAAVRRGNLQAASDPAMKRYAEEIEHEQLPDDEE